MDAYGLAAFGVVVVGILALVWMILRTMKELTQPKPIPPPTPCPPPKPSRHQLDPGDAETKIDWPQREEEQ